MCKSCRTCFMFYCMFYFTCDRSLNLSAMLAALLKLRRRRFVNYISRIVFDHPAVTWYMPGYTDVNPADDVGDTSPIFWLGDVNGNILSCRSCWSVESRVSYSTTSVFTSCCRTSSPLIGPSTQQRRRSSKSSRTY